MHILKVRNVQGCYARAGGHMSRTPRSKGKAWNGLGPFKCSLSNITGSCRQDPSRRVLNAETNEYETIYLQVDNSPAAIRQRKLNFLLNEWYEGCIVEEVITEGQQITYLNRSISEWCQANNWPPIG